MTCPDGYTCPTWGDNCTEKTCPTMVGATCGATCHTCGVTCNGTCVTCATCVGATCGGHNTCVC